MEVTKEEACAPLSLVSSNGREDDDVFDDGDSVDCHRQEGEEEEESMEKVFRLRPLSSIASYIVFLNVYGRTCDDRVVEERQLSAAKAEDYIPLEVGGDEDGAVLEAEETENLLGVSVSEDYIPLEDSISASEDYIPLEAEVGIEEEEEELYGYWRKRQRIA
ncbi:uncharacterized protein LOC110093430 [Dendrobium catenatum]|uniref:Uncharacterized protein n=1 Tax=Dendrobium catenatum TaxID=906689 RepID=A0A2I0W808_9ASPA|nr:uncharacterized protein LOC110093430 [Dendrobium catenatum]PKU71807.1 hypothetical protein MA16_Dca008336 [Dendrobium catenatum]